MNLALRACLLNYAFSTDLLYNLSPFVCKDSNKSDTVYSLRSEAGEIIISAGQAEGARNQKHRYLGQLVGKLSMYGNSSEA